MVETITAENDFIKLNPTPGGRILVSGLGLSSAAFLLSERLRRTPQTYLVSMPSPVEAEDFVRDLEFFWPEGAEKKAILLFPGYEIKPFMGESPSQDLVFARLWALHALLNDIRPLVVVASVQGALQKCLPKDVLSASTEYIEANEEVDREGLLDFLARSGYYPTNIVQSHGDFSVRGGILDIFPPGADRPVRAEFFGDYIESLRSFRTLDQRSVDDLREQVILPANEVIYRNGVQSRAADRLTEMAQKAGWIDLLWAPLAEKIGLGQYFPGMESFLPLFHDRLASVQEYAGPDVIRMIYEPDRLVEAGRQHHERLESHFAKVVDEERPHLPLADLYLQPDQLTEEPKDRRVIEVVDLPLPESGNHASVYQFRIESNQDLKAMIQTPHAGAGMLAPLAARVRTWLERGLTITLACHTREQAKRMADLLGPYKLYPLLNLDGKTRFTDEVGKFQIVVGFLTSGFALPALSKAYVTEDELFGPKRRVMRRAAEEVKGIQLSSFQDLGVGDFVVHKDHGVGQYLGLVKLEAGGIVNDFLHLNYKGGDKLYVPVERFNAVTKYVGVEDRPPALDKLGGSSWERVKEKVTESIREMAEELLKLYASRQVKSGHAYPTRDTYYQEFEASFEYEETPDQMGAIEDVMADMESAKPMDRLVCGDVGYGKTEVAVRAAFKAVSEGKQVAVLVPTTILAEQHFQTFVGRLRNYPIVVESLSRFKKPTEQREILKRLSEGKVDIVVGTHRLLQKDVVFRDLGLMVVDEEHRFGVAAKEKLKQIRAEVDVLAMSATPIPRTLQMSLTGIRDLSVIETPPQDRLAIKTYLIKYDEFTVCEAIARELERGGQVFFVHNRVRDINAVAARLKQLMPLVRFGVGHGQLKERELEEVMLSFLKKEIDVLVTTTIIESGLDFPSANTIIINNADRFGLSQIYQLRGRVGRSTVQAYSYLLVASPESLTRDARKRLRALLDFSELGAGFKIALHDLQIRGAGNLLGAAQSGQIAAVGYDMYVELMERTMRELKGEEIVEEIEPEMVLGMPAYIPETYVQDTEQRLIHYRQISSIGKLSELEDAASELLDRYGPPPPEVENLLLVMEIKQWLKKIRVKKLEVGVNGFTLTFVPAGPPDPNKMLYFIQTSKNNARLSPEGRLVVLMPHGNTRDGLRHMKNILQGLV